KKNNATRRAAEPINDPIKTLAVSNEAPDNTGNSEKPPKTKKTQKNTTESKNCVPSKGIYLFFATSRDFLMAVRFILGKNLDELS
ncbi:MAG: hypothetical protein DRP20_04215, partial [Thermotogae bacterium]